MADQAHEWTDEQIEALRRKFRRTYSQAAREMRAKLDNLMADFDTANKDWLERLKAGRVTQDEYDAWLKRMSTNQSLVGGIADSLANDAAEANRLVSDYINDRVPMVYAENANRAAFEVESGLGYDTHSFDLYDQSTVRRLIAEDNMLVREVKPDRAKDVAWNRQKFNGAITQSILQGESIPNTAKRLRTVLGMNENAAVRAARTAMTCAENAGRTDSYKRAKRIGIELEQEWMATLDQRTRHSHRELDGQHVPVGEKFKVDGIELEYPGDPSAPGEYVWNCRCTLVAWFPDIEQEDPARWSKLPEGMTYEQWKGSKEDERRSAERGAATRYTNMSNPLWSQLGPVDRNAVANKVDELLAGSKGRAASLWSTYEDRVKMVDPKHKGGAYYMYGDRGVHMNVQRSLDDADGRGALSTWFHEFGHNIDYLAGEQWRSRTTLYESGRFAATLKREVEGYIRERQTAFNNMLKSRDLQGLLDAGVIEKHQRWRVEHYYDTLAHIGDTSYLENEGWHLDFLRMSPQERSEYIWRDTVRFMRLDGRAVPIQNVRNAVGREITDGGKDMQLAIGDIYEGATRGRCQDTYGHGKSYWDSDGDHLAKEAFAEFFSAECIYSEKPGVLDIMIERFPESYQVYGEIVEEMLGAS